MGGGYLYERNTEDICYMGGDYLDERRAENRWTLWEGELYGRTASPEDIHSTQTDTERRDIIWY